MLIADGVGGKTVAEEVNLAFSSLKSVSLLLPGLSPLQSCRDASPHRWSAAAGDVLARARHAAACRRAL